MEHTNTKSWIKSIRLFRRLYHSLNNFRAKTKDRDFKEFSLLEYASIQPEDIKDLKRLRYIEKLQLAEKGYINQDLKKLLTYLKERDRVIHQGHNIIPIGNITVKEGDNPISSVQIGFLLASETFAMATYNHGNIPLWQSYDPKKLMQHISSLHPSSSEDLRLEHFFCGQNVLNGTKVNTSAIHNFYNIMIQDIFQCNAYFKTGIITPNKNLISKPKKYLQRQFHLPLITGEQPWIMTLTEVTERYFVFESFLNAAPKPEAFYFSCQEFKERFLDNNIDIIARLKYDLLLGIDKGMLHIGQRDLTTLPERVRWQSLNKCMRSNSLSPRDKFYISTEVISSKDFLIERSAILLKGNNKEAYLKIHYGTGQWYFAEIERNGAEPDYRPLDESTLQVIYRDYALSKNFSTLVTKLEDKPNEQIMRL